MNPARPRKPSHLNDDALLARLVELNAAHRLSLTSLLDHIAEVDVRRLFAKRGHSSMHRYCVRELNMSDDEAYARIRVARLGRRLPAVLAYLADGRLHLTAARLLASHLTPANHRAVLAEASGLNVAAVKQLVARLAPKPDVPTRVRALPARRTEPRTTSNPDVEPLSAPATLKRTSVPLTLLEPRSPSAPPPSPEAPPSPAAPRPKVAPPLTLEAPRAIVAPLAPERFEVRFTASAELIEKLTEVTALLSHAVPDGDLPTVFERALDLARAQLVKRRFGAGAVAAHLDASAGAAPVTADEVEAKRAMGRSPASPRDAKACPQRPSLAPTNEPTQRTPESRSATPRDAKASPQPPSLVPTSEPAQRTPESRSATPRDAKASPQPPSLAPTSEPTQRTPESRSATPCDAKARPQPPSLVPTSEPAQRTPESRSATPRDAKASPQPPSPAPKVESVDRARAAEGPSPASRCGARGDEVVSKPAPTREPSAQRSRYIPAAVRAEVWRRDEGRCTYVDPDTGHACGERRFLELHHEHPFAHGGAHDVEVLTLRCRTHNIWAARLDFGADHIDACIARR